jgi:iron complex outermembrane receptor protein
MDRGFPSNLSTLDSPNRGARTGRHSILPRSRLAQAVSLAVMASTSAPVLSQQLEEVIVTATKRAESVLDVSVAMTAMTGAETRLLNLNDMKDLVSFTPGFTGNSKDSFLDTVSIRGIRTNLFGNGAEPSIGMYINGTYQGRTGAGVSSLFDVERTEVLRGPQGFLFARGAVSGAVDVITAKASTEGVEGFIEGDFGERGVFVAEGAVNLPINDNFAVRIAGFHTEEDGYVDNLFGGPDLIAHDNDSLRVSFRYENDKLTGDLIFQYDDRNQEGSIYRPTGLGPNFNGGPVAYLHGGQPPRLGDERTVNIDGAENSRDIAEVFSTTLLLDYDLGFATLSSLTSYKDHDYEYGEDFDGFPIRLADYEQIQEGQYFEQELRLASNSEGPLSWYVGASYYQEDIETTFGNIRNEDTYCDAYFNYYNYVYYGNTERGCSTDYFNYVFSYVYGYEFTPSSNGLINDYNDTVGDYEGYSAYVEVGYAFNDQFDVTAGLRYSYDERTYSNFRRPDIGGSLFAGAASGQVATPQGPVSGNGDWSAITYRLAANYRPNEETLLFGSVSTGYKPGGYDVYGFTDIATGAGIPFGGEAIPGQAVPSRFEEETVTSYEVGYKGRLFDGRAQISWTAFFYQYEDLQSFTSIENPGGPGSIEVSGNAGKVDGWGSELEVYAALTNNINLRVGASWLDSEGTELQFFCGEGVNVGGDENSCEGESIPLTPEYTAFVVLNGAFPLGEGELFGNIAWSWEEEARGDWIPEALNPTNVVTFLNQTDIVLGYQTDSWTISGYVENVFDENWDDGSFVEQLEGGPFFPQTRFGPSRPRTAGIRGSYNF